MLITFMKLTLYNTRKDEVDREQYIKELLDKYDIDELLDIFVSNYSLTNMEFCDRMIDYIERLRRDDYDR